MIILSDVSNGICTKIIQDIGPQPYIFIPLRMGVHTSNNPVVWKCTEDSNPMELQYTGVAAT